MPNHRKPKTNFQKEAEAFEPMFWLIPEWLRIITPMDVATKRELIDMKIETRRIERLADGEETGWLQDALYTLMMHTWLHIWTFLMIILGLVLMVAAYVLWFWFLGYVIYWLFIK